MHDSLFVVDGSTFFMSDRVGDTSRDDAGLFFADTRHISELRLTVNGDPLRLLTSDKPYYYAGRITGTLNQVRVGFNPTITVRRDRIVADGVHEDIVVENHSGEERKLRVELAYAADFADLFEVKADDVRDREVSVEVREDEVLFAYETGGFRRGTRLTFSTPGEFTESSAAWSVVIPPRGAWSVCVDITLIEGDVEHDLRAGHGGFGQLQPHMSESLEDWVQDAPELTTDLDHVERAYAQALVDLAALRFRPYDSEDWAPVAAGMPWFMTLFGRDSLLTAYQAIAFQPLLARETLLSLAKLQSTERNDFRDSEPGKILHEVRRGQLSAEGATPSPYYGAADTTSLFLIVLDEYEHWTGDTDLVRQLEPAARAALEWIETSGDSDGDGYVEYEQRSSAGLQNHCWRDSDNSILFADGRQARGPIATCELQGYAYDARVRTARLAREVWGDAELADRLERDAAALRERFNRDYWSDERGHFVLALDGAKQQVDSLTSNLGHLLWSGIVDDEHAAATIAKLCGPELASGWGIRTMSADDAGYNPIEYHNGSVWPHDTAIAAEGLRRYGAIEQAEELALALFEASAAFEYELPEVFAGFERERPSTPVEYPTASRPQAWAAGSLLLALRTLFGLDVEDGRLVAKPSIPGGRMTGIPVRGERIDVA